LGSKLAPRQQEGEGRGKKEVILIPYMSISTLSSQGIFHWVRGVSQDLHGNNSNSIEEFWNRIIIHYFRMIYSSLGEGRYKKLKVTVFHLRGHPPSLFPTHHQSCITRGSRGLLRLPECSLLLLEVEPL